MVQLSKLPRMGSRLFLGRRAGEGDLIDDWF